MLRLRPPTPETSSLTARLRCSLLVSDFLLWLPLYAILLVSSSISPDMLATMIRYARCAVGVFSPGLHASRCSRSFVTSLISVCSYDPGRQCVCRTTCLVDARLGQRDDTNTLHQSDVNLIVGRFASEDCLELTDKPKVGQKCSRVYLGSRIEVSRTHQKLADVARDVERNPGPVRDFC